MDMYKIGFIDEDEMEVKTYEMRLRGSFDVIGYEITEGMSVDDLLRQVYDSDIDLLMVDYLMVDKGLLTFNGDEVVRKYEEIKPKFPMIIFTNEEKQAFPVVDNPNTLYKKEMTNKEHLPKFIEILRKNIEIYIDYKNKRKNTIDELLQKAQKEGLDGKEKHLLTEAQFELLSLDKWANEVPSQLLKGDKVDDLAKTTREAEAFLASLIKKSRDDAAEK